MSRSCVDQGQACLSPLVGVKVKVEDHLLIKAKLVSRSCVDQGQACLSPFVGVKLKGRKVCVDQGFVRVDHHSRPSEDMPKSASPILVHGGATCESSPSEAQSRKVVRLEGMKIVFIDLKWINAQGKGMILIGFLFCRSHDIC